MVHYGLPYQELADDLLQIMVILSRLLIGKMKNSRYNKTVCAGESPKRDSFDSVLTTKYQTADEEAHNGKENSNTNF